MRRNSSFLFPLISILFCLSAFSYAQNWSGIIAPARATDWTQAGVIGGIPTNWPNCATAACNTLLTTPTCANLNSAISSAPSQSVVNVPAGTISSCFVNIGRPNVILRGAGADQTKILGSSGSCSFHGDICMGGNSPVGGDINSASSINVSVAPARGDTAIRLASTTGLSAGMYVGLDQLQDPGPDTNQVYLCVPYSQGCSDEGGGAFTRNGSNRVQQEYHKISAVNSGCTAPCIVVTPPVMYPQWSLAKTPQVFYLGTASNQPQMIGVENLTLDYSGSAPYAAIDMGNCYSCWVTGSRLVTVSGSTVETDINIFASPFATIRNNYFYGAQRLGSESSAMWFYDTSNDLIENNILVHLIAPFYVSGGGAGSVVSYNYNVDNPWTVDTTSINATTWLHDAGSDYMLFEGNVGIGWWSDDIHGTHAFDTVFRNRWYGEDLANPSRTNQNTPIIIRAIGRYYNVIGNVLGVQGRQNGYESGVSIYDLGSPQHAFGGNNCGGGHTSPCLVPQDNLVNNSLMRWGNYDTFNAAVRFVNSEVPSALNDGSGTPSLYVNPVPANQNLPASFYLTATPSFFGSNPWPGIGPDVTGGDLPNVGGHAYRNPAEVCFESLANDPAYAANTVRVFNADTCYAGDPPPPPPAPPTGLSATVQ